MTTITEIEYEIQDHPRLAESYRKLISDGWQLKRQNIILSNSYVDGKNKILYIDDDEEGILTLVSWVEEAVRNAYLSDDDYRRMCTKDYAILIFKDTTITDLEKMVRVYEWSAWFFDPPGLLSRDIFLFMDDMMLVLTPANPSLYPGTSSRVYYIFRLDPTTHKPIYGVSAECTGFKKEFRDCWNQVTHATASIQASLRYFLIGFMFAQARETSSSPADLRINKACFAIAYILGNIRMFVSDVSLTGIGNIVREKLGDPSQTGPWRPIPNAGDPLCGGLPD